MTNAAARTFDAAAEDYDVQRRRLIPCFDAFYGAAVRALELAHRPPARVLDLGAGTGVLARHIAAAHPPVELTLLDGAPAMLAEARKALGDRAAYVTADFEAPLPAGPWDAVVSALAIHHLDDDAKRDLIGRVHDALAPGGVFVNAEQILGPTPALDAAYLARQEAGARAAGSDDEEWAAAMDRMRHDRCATVADQLAWLTEAGFVDVDAPFRDGRFAVLVGRRA
jgi:tRNA (cmo5U34)-methyltransferase